MIIISCTKMVRERQKHKNIFVANHALPTSYSFSHRFSHNFFFSFFKIKGKTRVLTIIAPDDSDFSGAM